MLALLIILPACVSAEGIYPDPGPKIVLSSWSFGLFDDWLTSDYGYAEIASSNLSSSILGDGVTLSVDSTNEAFLSYHVVEPSDGTTNLSLSSGALELWFAPNWSNTNGSGGPGGWGRIIEVGTYTTNASYGWWSLYFDPAGTNIYFAGQSNNGAGGIYLSAPISGWTSNYWHMLVLNYSQTNSSLFIDGVPVVTNGFGVTNLPPLSVATNVFYLGSDAGGTEQVHGMIDDVVTFAEPISPAAITRTYTSDGSLFYGNPINGANLVSGPPTWSGSGPTFNAYAGYGSLQPDTNYVSTNCITSTNLWFTNVTAVTTGGTVTISFVIAGGTNGVPVDVFGTSGLRLGRPADSQWVWIGEGYPCHRYALTNLTDQRVALLLAKKVDSDFDGLTDAFEDLVSKTSPTNWDSYGDGVMDWWHWYYFGTNAFNPDLSPFADGRNYLEKYLDGLDPTTFDTPPAPHGVVVTLNQSNGTAKVFWQPSSGAVTGYTVSRFDPWTYDTTNFYVGLTNVFIDPSYPTFNYTDYDYPNGYSVQAHYLLGDSDWSELVFPFPFSASAPDATTISGPSNSTYVAVFHIPRNVSAIRISRIDLDYGNYPNVETLGTNLDFSPSLFTNSLVPFPQSIVGSGGPDGSSYWLQYVFANGALSLWAHLSLPDDPFHDARSQMKDNLAFLLRAATASAPLRLKTRDDYGYNPFPYASDYAYADDAGCGYGVSFFTYSAFNYNYLFRNLSWDTRRCYQDSDGSQYVWADPPAYTTPPLTFPGFTNSTMPSILSSTQTTWIACSSGNPADVGVLTNSTGCSISTSCVNWFGLPLSVSGGMKMQ